MSDIKLKFGTPKHGWMDVTIVDEQKEVNIIFSHVPCNSIEKLAYALLNLKGGSNVEEVEFSLEPDYALWRFRGEEDKLILEVFPDSKREHPIVFESSKDKVLHRLYKSLKDLESNPCWQKPNAQEVVWSWSFPSEDLRRFKGG